jgi:ketosteroid isomerase-like protein
MATKTSERELIDLERQYWNALKEKDIDTAIRLTDDPCIVTGAHGVMRIDRKTFERMMRDASWTINEFEIKDDPDVRLVNGECAIVAYKIHEKLTVDGEPVSVDAADASTWVRRNGNWVCALHTEAIAGDPFGRDRKTAN